MWAVSKAKRLKVHACVKCNPNKDVYWAWVLKKLTKFPPDLAKQLEADFRAWFFKEGDPKLIYFVNGGIGIDKTLDHAWVGKTQAIITRITSTIKKLHPLRRRLAILNEFSQMYLGTIDYVQCGHCYQLVHEALAALDIKENEWQNDLMEHFPEYVKEDDQPVNNNVLSDLPIKDYANNPLWKLEVVCGDIFRTEFIDTGEGDGYFPHDLFDKRDYQVEDTEDIDGPDPVLCWRFFKTTCKVCNYQVAPSKAHCLACYYFLDVLNELVASLCPIECWESEWNQVRRWPRKKN